MAQGVLGVAFLQALLAGIGMLAVGVPGAGLWALLVLMLAIIQLPPILIRGRWMDIPMLLILIGALGGMILSGTIGLFVGAVVLALAYRLFLVWLNDDLADPEAKWDSESNATSVP